MSHEFRTPVNGIIGLIDIIDEEIRHPDLQSYTQMIRQSASRLLDTITSILEISRNEAEGKQLKLINMKPDDLLRQSLPVFKVLTNKSGVVFKQHLSQENPTVLLDENVYYQVINNLLGNAVKFTDVGQIILETSVVRKENGKTYHCTRVEDTGIGMDSNFQKKIFSPFEQENQDYSRKHEGTGLGLAIVKKYTELFGGSIRFQSEKNKGTVFEVFFPCANT